MEALPKYAGNVAPKPKSKAKVQAQRKTKYVKFQKPSWDTVDIAMVVLTIATFLFMCGLVLAKSSNVATVNTQLASVTTQLEQTRNKNNDLKQEISNLTNPNRLGKIADKNGLSLQDQNIRNVK